jgi:sensor c-di-GMP phosphodiesterase-like protein
VGWVTTHDVGPRSVGGRTSALPWHRQAVVAEGVEDRDALERLTAYGTDIAQGFYFSPPLAPDDFTTWLAERLSPITA